MDKFQDFEIHSNEVKESILRKFLRMIRRIVFPALGVGICLVIGYIIYTEDNNYTIIDSKKIEKPDKAVKIYSWIDKDGVRRYSDVRPQDQDLQVTEMIGYQEDSFFQETVKKVRNTIRILWKRIKSYYKRVLNHITNKQ